MQTTTVDKKETRLSLIAEWEITAAWLVEDKLTGRSLGSITRHGRDDADAYYSVRRAADTEGPFPTRAAAVRHLATTEIVWGV